MTDDRGDPLWINVDALDALDALDISPEAYGLAIRLVTRFWWPTRQPFAYDPEALAAHGLAPDLTAADYRRLNPEVARLFVILDDGRWAPSPEFFSLTDGNAEARG